MNTLEKLPFENTVLAIERLSSVYTWKALVEINDRDQTRYATYKIDAKMYCYHGHYIDDSAEAWKDYHAR